jgi:hypothetical protein
VADQSSISFAAVTIQGTRGLTTPSTTTPAATTIVPITTAVVIPTVVVTKTPPGHTITLAPSIVTITPPAPHNATFASVVPVTPVVVTPLASTLVTLGNGSTPIQPIVGTECAICTAGLINAGRKMGLQWMQIIGWTVWIGIVAGFILVR